MSANDLQALLKSLVDRYGTQTALAKAIGITDSRLAKVLKGESGALSVRNCLRLAKVAHLSPSQILRAAGKSDIADLIEQLYGKSAQPALAADLAAPELAPKVREHLRAALRELDLSEKKARRRKR